MSQFAIGNKVRLKGTNSLGTIKDAAYTTDGRHIGWQVVPDNNKSWINGSYFYADNELDHVSSLEP